MQVQVLAHMPYQGKQYKPGETIPENVWMKGAEAARLALVNQGLVQIGAGRGTRASQRASAPEGAESPASSDVVELLQGMNAKLERVLSLLGEGPPATVKKARARR